MKVDRRGLDAIDIKLKRAKEHLRFLNNEMLAWDELARSANKPWGLVPEVHDQGLKHFFRLRFIKPFPVEWAVIMGEALHDLRSAMDQCVFWLTVDWCHRDLEGTGFPVYTRRAGFYQRERISARNDSGWARTSGMYKVRGIGPAPLAFIEALQPYPQRRPLYCREMRMINDLWNQDKHRLVHLWGLRFTFGELRMPQEMAADSHIFVDKRVLHDRAIPLKVVTTNPRQQVKVTGPVGASIAFYAGKRTGGGSESFWDLTTVVEDVIRKLLAAIGKQNTPISLADWTPLPGYSGAQTAPPAI